MSTFSCPKPASIASIPDQTCGVNFDQVVRMALQRRDQASFDEGMNPITAVATWTPLLAAADDTKVQFTPIMYNVTIPHSEALTEGGNDNSTIHGIEDYNGQGFVKVEFMFKALGKDVAKALRDLTVESIADAGITDLVAYFVNRHGDLIHNNLKGFDIYNLEISSVGSEGFNKKNTYRASFSMSGEWDNDFVITPAASLDFNPVTLKNA